MSSTEDPRQHGEDGGTTANGDSAADTGSTADPSVGGNQPTSDYQALRPGDPDYGASQQGSGQQPVTASYPPAPAERPGHQGQRPSGQPSGDPATSANQPYGYGQSGWPQDSQGGQSATQPYAQAGWGGQYGPTQGNAGHYGATQPNAGQYSTGQYGGGQYGGGQYGGGQYGAYGEQPVPAETADTTAAGQQRGNRRAVVLLVLVAALLGGGVGGGIVAIADHNGGNSVNTGLKITNSTGAPAAQLDGTIGAAAAKIRPSVVTINVTGQQASGTGSGVIVRTDGTILTNDHVVDISGGSGHIQVVLSDGRTATGKIIGRDTSDDLAVIKVDGLDNLTAATFAKSSSLTVGQAVVAVGAPLGLSDTVTSGIVSNTARPVRAGDNDQAVFNAVQTDAAINPGNSGGPLVDLNGSVVGINAAIASDNSGGGGLQIPGQQTQSGNIGIGFAIPADEASRIASELVATGKATHAVLGVEVTSSTSTTATAGVPLHTITPGGVADKAGLKVGDLVTQIGDQQVTTADALIAAVRSHAPGDQVKVTYTRSGKNSTVTVTLGSSDS
jgi:putative serine protease PepD